MLTLRARMATAMIVLVLVTAGSVVWLSNRAFASQGLPEALNRLGSDVRLLGGVLQTSVVGAAQDVLVMGRLPSAAELALGRDTSEPLEQLAAVFEGEIQVKRRYLQLRFIDAAGRELVRVDRSGPGGGVRRVPPTELQNKIDRPYVTSALGLPPGTLFVSTVELNEEFGVVQTPPVPVARLAVPVASPEGTAGGLVVANVDMRPLFDALRLETAEARDVYVLGDGVYLVHPDRTRELGGGDPFVRPGELEHLPPGLPFDSTYTALVEMSDSHVGLAARTIRLAGGPPLTVVLTESEARLLGSPQRVMRSALLAGTLAALMAMVLAAVFARTLSRPVMDLAASVRRFEAWGTWEPPRGGGGGDLALLSDTLGRVINSEREKQAALEREVEIRSAAEAALEKEAEQLRLLSAVVQSSHDGIYTLTLDGVVTSWNPGAESLYGYRADEIIGRHKTTLVPERLRSEVDELLRRVRRGAAVRNFETVRLAKGGEERHVALTLSPVYSDTGSIVGVSEVARDISKRMKAQEELERSNAELEQFAYVASHDLQEPLRMVASYTELLAQRYEGRLDERADKYIRYSVDGAKRMQLLINDLLRFSRINSEAKPPEPTDLGHVVREVVDSRLAVSVRESGGTVEIEELPVLLTDEVQIGQVFQNLISNALKFRADGRAPAVRVGAERRGSEWVFSVADNGIGIEAEYEGRVFEMFQRLHGVGTYPGSGIGLTLARKIVQRHGGRIWFESVPGSGTTFYFTLPATPAAIPAGLEA